MSLLMEALKKAERAKQGQTVPQAQQFGEPDSEVETPGSTATSSPEFPLLHQEGTTGHGSAPGDSDFPGIATTQDTPSPIPDLAPLTIEAPARVEPTISTLELTLDEPPPTRVTSVSPAPPTPGTEPEIRQKPATNPESSTGIPPARHAEARHKASQQNLREITKAQQQAKAVFSAKQPARSQTLLLTGTAVAVVLGLAGIGIYYWQITSTGTMALPASTPQPTNATATAIPVDTGVPQQQDTPAATAQNPVGKPVLRPVEGPAPMTAQTSPPATSVAYDPAQAETRGGPEPFKEKPAIQIRQSAATSLLNPTLGKAYQSFLSGDTASAQQLYHKVLQQEPNNRDALLGMAALALKNKQSGQAAAYYGKLLDLDPADPDALGGLINLQGQSDPAQSESRLKKVLLQNPQADAIHFALGNLYTQQSRWAEAQQSYFRAYSSVPGNADYAFNLAVSLDHLGQGKLALDYYQRALAQPGPANFDKSSAQTRIKELLQAASN